MENTKHTNSVGSAGAVTTGGSTSTIIDPVCLEEYIRELRTLSETVANAVFKPIDAAQCGGRTINEIETMGKLFGDMREAFLLLIQNTISYMEGRKTSVDTKEAASAAAVK